MGKTPNFQKWAFHFLNLLIVAIATFSGEFLITRANPLDPSPVPSICTLRHSANAGTKLDIPPNLSNAGNLIKDFGGSGTSSTFSLNCSVATIASPNLDPNGHTFTRNGVTYDHVALPVFDGGNGGDTLGPPKKDNATKSTFHVITVNHPDLDKVTWDFTNLQLSPSQKFTFATHPYQNAATAPQLKFKLNGSTPSVSPTNDPLQVVFSSQSDVTKIVLGFNGVKAGAQVKVGEFFVGHN